MLGQGAMSGDHVMEVIARETTSIERQDRVARFVFDDVPMVCIYDTQHDRMRIIAPIVRSSEVGSELLRAAMIANFHTALDARYAISDGVVYAAFLHPLAALTDELLLSALHQVASLAKTFGTTFSGGALHFPGSRQRQPTPHDGIGT